MKRTVKLNEVVEALNHAEKFHTSVEAVEWKDDETQTGLIVVSTETSVGEYFYNVAFTFANDNIAIDEEQDFIDGLWHVEGVDVIDKDGELVDKFEVPSEFPASATAIDFEKLKNDLRPANNGRY